MGTNQPKAVCLCDSDMKEVWNKDIFFSFPRAQRHSTQKAPHWLWSGHDTMKGCCTIDLPQNRPKAAVAVFIWIASQVVDKLGNRNVTWVPRWESENIDLAMASWHGYRVSMMSFRNILPKCYEKSYWGACLNFSEWSKDRILYKSCNSWSAQSWVPEWTISASCYPRKFKIRFEFSWWVVRKDPLFVFLQKSGVFS